MNTQPPEETREERIERALRALLGALPDVPEARLRAIRSAVFQRLAEPCEYRLADFFRWRLALPVALSLLLCGAAAGWTVEPGGDPDPALALLDGGPVMGDFE